ncbi:MAG: T9SS type A sorting domain-containing protein [Psychroserpens sp.]|uniref:T9SS type A sorting domain-containing protein n=1 Tax=Psychroserpens sp. TaxID=2020870 RepID=UPI003C7414EC
MKNLFFTLALTACYLNTHAQDLSKTMTVSGGTSVSIETGTTLYADELNLKSTSDEFSSLLLKGDVGTATVVNYDRYVNEVGVSGVEGGNDVISLPLKQSTDVTFGEFLQYSADNDVTTNADYLANSPSTSTLFAFGPYDNSATAYTNYNNTLGEDANVLLQRAVGYRAATETSGGTTLRFTGTASKVAEAVNISTSGINFWNSVGNPYSTYVDSQAFLTANVAVLKDDRQAIYAYNNAVSSGVGTSGNFTIINFLVNNTINIAPGQGFLLANSTGDGTPNIIDFTPAMRTFNGSDDFIIGRDASPSPMLRLKAEHSNGDFATEIYFNINSSLGLDPGYDAGVYGGTSYSFMLYSHLIEDNQGVNMAIQSLGSNDINDTVIPLGLKATQGQQITFSIENSTLPDDTDVYLEDNLTNTFTLLNANNYTITANSNISGTGRFFLRVGSSTLSTIDTESSSLHLFASEQTIFVKGQLLEQTKISVYDLLGREVLSSNLEQGSDTNTINASTLKDGIYVVTLKNGRQEQTKKVIIK